MLNVMQKSRAAGCEDLQCGQDLGTRRRKWSGYDPPKALVLRTTGRAAEFSSAG